MEQTNRRRTLIVNRPYQKHIVYRLLWPSAVVVMFAGLLTIVFCVQLAQEADAVDVPLPTLVPFLIAAASFTICGTALMGLNALRLSHRIAGPMYRIKRTLEAVQNGNLAIRANLRRGDELQDLATDLNEFLDWLERHPPTGVQPKAPVTAGALVSAPELQA
jgi:methyl-accepting chemotaxis protein